MDLLKLSGAIQSGALFPFVNCRFTVSVGDVSLAGEEDDDGFPAFALPNAPRPLTIRVHVEPSEPTTHAIDADFTVDAAGQIAAAATTQSPPTKDHDGQAVPGETRDVDPAEFLPPRAIRTKSGHMFLVTFVLSRIHDATQHTLIMLNVHNEHGVPRPQIPRPASWDPRPQSLHVIADRPVASDRLAFEPSAAAPTGEMRILALKLPTETSAPHYLAVFWPDAVTRERESAAAPVLVYFHAAVSQNVPRYYERRDEIRIKETYPDGWDYLFYGLFQYMQYDGDPFAGGDAPYTKGIPHQMAMSGKPCVAVLPQNSFAQEIGAFMHGDAMQDALSEIVAYMFRRRGILRSPGVGRTALAAFSSGNNFVTSFLAANRHTAFYTSTLKEVYMFDAPMGRGPTRGQGMDRWVKQALKWLASGPSAEKKLRAYVQEATGNLRAIVTGLKQAPTVGESSDAAITVSILPPPAWAQAIRANGGTPDLRDGGFGETHQMISAVMLTDALRRSGF
jgi:hypothetical protein